MIRDEHFPAETYLFFMRENKNLTDSNELKILIDKFLEYHEVQKGSSPLTIRNYYHCLMRFLNFLEENKLGLDLNSLNTQNLNDYRVYLARIKTHPNLNETLSRKTQGYHAIALRSFIKWLTKNDYNVMSADKIELPKIDDRKIKFLAGEDVDRLLAAPDLSSIQGLRDKAILELLFSTGLRVSELVSINRDDINFERREFGVVGKGGKARVVFISSRAANFIERYLNGRDDHFKPLFIRHKGKVAVVATDDEMRLTPRSIQRMVKKYAKKIKLAVDVTPHVIRHSFATDLLVAGADIRSVQEMLGHKNIATTQIYTHVTNKHLKDVHEAFHGKGK